MLEIDMNFYNTCDKKLVSIVNHIGGESMIRADNISFVRKFAVITIITVSSFIPQMKIMAEEKYSWHPDDADISVCSTEFLNLYTVDHNNYFTGKYEEYYEKDVTSGIRLLMVDGGFVMEPETLIDKDGTVYIEINKFLYLMGVESTEEIKNGKFPENGITLTKNDTVLEIPNLRDNRVLLNGSEIIMPHDIESCNGIYVPLRFMAETFGCTVQYIEDFEKTICEIDDTYAKIHMIVIETGRKYEKVYTVEEGLKIVKEESIKKHEQVVRLIDERGFTFGADGVKDDYDPQLVSYMGYDMGRFYIYRLDGFHFFPIFFNKYTGEVYGVMSGRPMLIIDNGFPNINFIY